MHTTLARLGEEGILLLNTVTVRAGGTFMKYWLGAVTVNYPTV